MERVAADQVAGGVVVHHQEDHLTFADQTGHVVLGDVIGDRPKAEGSYSRASSPALTSPCCPGRRRLAGGIAAFKPVPVNEGDPGRSPEYCSSGTERGAGRSRLPPMPMALISIILALSG